MTTTNRQTRLFAERLEDRMVLSTIPFLDPGLIPAPQAYIMAGQLPDSPQNQCRERPSS